MHATGDIHGTYEYGCKVFRKRMECALMIKAAEALDPAIAKDDSGLAHFDADDCGGCEDCQ